MRVNWDGGGSIDEHNIVFRRKFVSVLYKYRPREEFGESLGGTDCHLEIAQDTTQEQGPSQSRGIPEVGHMVYDIDAD